jgi:hypothetical protein
MGESMFLTSWVAGEKKIEGSLCVISAAFCSAASDETTSGSAASTGSSAGCDVFCAALRRVAAFLPHRVVLFTAWGSLGPCSVFKGTFEVAVGALRRRGALTVSKDRRPPGDNGCDRVRMMPGALLSYRMITSDRLSK